MSDTSEQKLVKRDRALLIVGDTTIHGSTRLQKYGFLLSKQFERELANISFTEKDMAFYDDWKPLWYGPFSKSLQEDIDECVEKGLVYKELINLSLNSYRYSLTVKGRVRWRVVYAKFQNDMKAIHEKIMSLQKVRLERLLEGIYTAYPDYTKRSTIRDRFS